MLQLIGESDPLHELHVDEPWVFLLDVLELLVRSVTDPLLGVSGHTDEVGDYLDRMDQPLGQDQLDNLQCCVSNLRVGGQNG